MPACKSDMCVGISKVMKCAICFLSFSWVADLMGDFYPLLQDDFAANRCSYRQKEGVWGMVGKTCFGKNVIILLV